MARARSVAQQVFEPEIDILPVLAGVLVSKRAVDVGANHGAFTAALRAAGFEVDSYEPLPQLAAELRQRFAGDDLVRVHELACSNVDGIAQLFAIAAENEAVDPTLFSSLQEHPMFEGLEFDNTMKVEARRLDSLMADEAAIGILKVDTEGHDLAVIEGMGKLRPEAVMLEVWDEEFIFNQGKTENRLIDYARRMDKNYYNHSVLFWRDSLSNDFGITLNAVDTCPGGWGNVLFMHDSGAFEAVRSYLKGRFRRVSDAASFF